MKFPEKAAIEIIEDYEKLFSFDVFGFHCVSSGWSTVPVWGLLRDIHPVGFVSVRVQMWNFAAESGLFVLGRDRFRYERKGRLLEIRKGTEVIGTIYYSLALRRFGFGKAEVFCRGRNLATFWNTYGLGDLIWWKNHYRQFLMKGKKYPYLHRACEQEQENFEWNFYAQIFPKGTWFRSKPNPEATPVFSFQNYEEIRILTSEEKLILFFSILWSRMF